MSKVFRRKYTCKKTGRAKRTKKYYGYVTDELGIRCRIPLCSDKAASEAMLNEKRIKAERAKHGLSDPFDDHHKRPLAEQVVDFRRHLEAKGNEPRGIRNTVARVQAIIDGCQFRRIPDISASAVASWLADQRDADAFGISTSNGYLTAVQSFCKWLVKDRRTGDNRLLHLSKVNADTDVRVERRAVSADELSRLIGTTEQSSKTYRGLTGTDRAMLYRTATFTGLRASELASLIESSFDFAGDLPTVTVEAAYSKRRRRDEQPLHPDLSARLQQWLAGRRENERGSLTIRIDRNSQDAKLWPGTWYLRAAEMLRDDLNAVNIPYFDEADRVFDFHALRGQYVTDLARSGVSQQEAQKLARHSDPRLTAKHYTHLSVTDLSAANSKLPTLPTSSTDAKRATGTDDLTVDSTGPLTGSKLAQNDATGSKLARTAGRECPLVSTDDHLAGSVSLDENRGSDHDSPPLSMDDSNRAGRTRTYNQQIMSLLL